MDAKEIIDKILKELKIKAPTFASNIGVQYQRIYDIQRNKTKRISTEIADLISLVYPQFNLSWLLTGEGEMLKGAIPQTQNTSSENVNVEDPTSWFKNKIDQLIEDNRRNVMNMSQLIEENSKNMSQLIEDNRRSNTNIALLIEENIKYGRRLDGIISMHGKCFDDIKKETIQEGSKSVKEYEAEEAKKGGTTVTDTGKAKLANK